VDRPIHEKWFTRSALRDRGVKVRDSALTEVDGIPWQETAGESLGTGSKG